MTDRPLPSPVDEAVSWEEMAPSLGDIMLAAGGVALESPADAAKACSKLRHGLESGQKTSGGAMRIALWREGNHSTPTNALRVPVGNL